MQPFTFNYYHLYSAPIFNGSQFKAIVPRNRFLLKNELYYSFTSDPCKKATPQEYICKKLNLEEISNDEPCEIQLLENKNTSICKKIQIVTTKSRMLRIEESSKVIGVFPEEEVIKLNCNQQIETVRLKGSFLFDVPHSCAVVTNQGKFTIEEFTTGSQPMILPKLQENIEKKENFKIQLEDINLDELHAVKNYVLQNPPFRPVIQQSMFESPNLWTIMIYILLGVTTSYLCYKKYMQFQQGKKLKKRVPEQINIEDVQLPH